jgi:hypothetical protein
LPATVRSQLVSFPEKPNYSLSKLLPIAKLITGDFTRGAEIA